MLKGHLGSTDVITDSAGQPSFDPLGQRRNALGWEAALSQVEQERILDMASPAANPKASWA